MWDSEQVCLDVTQQGSLEDRHPLQLSNGVSPMKGLGTFVTLGHLGTLWRGTPIRTYILALHLSYFQNAQ